MNCFGKFPPAIDFWIICTIIMDLDVKNALIHVVITWSNWRIPKLKKLAYIVQIHSISAYLVFADNFLWAYQIFLIIYNNWLKFNCKKLLDLNWIPPQLEATVGASLTQSFLFSLIFFIVVINFILSFFLSFFLSFLWMGFCMSFSLLKSISILNASLTIYDSSLSLSTPAKVW